MTHVVSPEQITPNPHYIALGMLATTTEEPPGQEELRCVPPSPTLSPTDPVPRGLLTHDCVHACLPACMHACVCLCDFVSVCLSVSVSVSAGVCRGHGALRAKCAKRFAPPAPPALPPFYTHRHYTGHTRTRQCPCVCVFPSHLIYICVYIYIHIYM